MPEKPVTHWDQVMSTFRERDTLETRILNFFDANRDEMLYIEDIRDKFDAKQKHAQTVAKGLVERGLLKRERVPSKSNFVRYAYRSVYA